MLDSGARDDLLPPQPNARLARSFRPQDVTNLLAILGNAALAPELRRSGAEQLLALTVDDRLRALMLEQVGVRAEIHTHTYMHAGMYIRSICFTHAVLHALQMGVWPVPELAQHAGSSAAWPSPALKTLLAQPAP